VALLGPSLAIYAADILLRRNHYDGVALNDEAPGSTYWFSHGFNWAGVCALVIGTGVAVLCVNTPDFVGPISNLLDGADISSRVGPALAAGIYAAMTLRQRRAAASTTVICEGTVS